MSKVVKMTEISGYGSSQIYRIHDEVARMALIAAQNEIERLQAERDTFYMDYRIKCDEETKRLETDLDAAKRVIDSMVVAEVEPLKALLREVLDQCRETDKMQWDGHLYKRIRDALKEDQ